MTGPYAYRGPDGDLLLEEALGPHLRHYVGIMVAGADGTRAQAAALGGWAEGVPVRRGHELPVRASSCGALAVLPEWSWDVCGYYASLGVRWDAPKGDVRRAYIAACARDGGQEQDEYLTYVVAQLSDAAVRRAYDMTPLGGLFLGDKYVQAALKRAAAAEASRRLAAGERSSADEVLAEMGLRAERAPERGESAPAPEAPRPREAPREARASRWSLRWGHYLVPGPQGRLPDADPALLESWQAMVADALRERGIVISFAVGTAASGEARVLRNINESCIFVMNEEGPSPEKAKAAVEKGISLGIVTENSTGGI